jgi:hypothetical protein
MAAQKLFRKPSLDVVQGDYLGPMLGVVYGSATVTYLKPGVIVKMSTNDNEIDIAGTTDISNNLGVLGYEATPLAYKPATRDTAYAVGDHVAVHNTPGMRFRGHLTPSSGAVAPGTLLVHAADASGNLEIYLGPTTGAISGTGLPTPIARALESVTPGTSYASLVCWCQWL